MKLQDLFEQYTFNIVHTNSETEEGDPENYEQDVTTEYYNIEDENGNVVGELSKDDYFGYVRGHLYNKDLPELSEYGRFAKGPGLQELLHTFINGKRGQKWMSNIDKYKPLSGPTNDYRIKR